MAIVLRVTNVQTGITGDHLHQNEQMQTSPVPVPTYDLQIEHDTGTWNFNCIRSTSSQVYGEPDAKLPCPANRPGRPYNGWIRTDKDRWRIQVYEAGIEYALGKTDAYHLQGTGSEIRQSVLIHGPGRSDGCIIVIDWEKFKILISELYEVDLDRQFIIYVNPL